MCRASPDFLSSMRVGNGGFCCYPLVAVGSQMSDAGGAVRVGLPGAASGRVFVHPIAGGFDALATIPKILVRAAFVVAACCSGAIAGAEPAPVEAVAPQVAPAAVKASFLPIRRCRPNEDSLRVLKMTAIEDGIRVDYQFVVSGRESWTNMNRPLLAQMGIRQGRSFCMPHETESADIVDTD